MICVNSVMNSLFTSIASDQTVVNSNFLVCLDEEFNSNMNVTPWVGVYFGALDFEPHTSNVTRPWMANFNLLVYVQEHSHSSGMEANDALNRALTPVLTAINCNRTLDGTVHRIIGMQVDPFQRDLQDMHYVFTDQITIQAQVQA